MGVSYSVLRNGLRVTEIPVTEDSQINMSTWGQIQMSSEPLLDLFKILICTLQT